MKTSNRWIVAAAALALLATTTLGTAQAEPMAPWAVINPGPVITANGIAFDYYPQTSWKSAPPTKDGDVITTQYSAAAFSGTTENGPARTQIVTPAYTQSPPRALSLNLRYGGGTAGYYWAPTQTIGGCGTADTQRTAKLVITFPSTAAKRWVTLYTGRLTLTPSLTPYMAVWRKGKTEPVVVAGTFYLTGIRNKLSYTTGTTGPRDIYKVEVYYRTSSCTKVSVPLPAIDSLTWD